jgi:hypothetical protein
MNKQAHHQEAHMRITKLIFLVLMFSVLSACSSFDVKKTSHMPGETAYDFTLPDQNGKLLKLSDVMKEYRGAVLAFYPKDDTKN